MRRKFTSIVLLFIALALLFPFFPNTAKAAGETINTPASYSVNYFAWTPLSGVSITASGNPTLTIRLFVNHGLIRLGTSTGLTVDDSQNGTLEITGLLSDINAGLATLSYKAVEFGTENLEISIAATGEIFNPLNDHIYEFVDAPTGIDWNDANADALSRTKYGLTGYLVTITSDQENTFIAERMLVDGWMGASDAGVDGEWRWVTGPEAGTQFWQGLDAGSGGAPVGGEYSNWLDIEPNNFGGDEDCGQFYAQQGPDLLGTWNDLDCGNNGINGYIVEYGEPGDTAEIVNKSVPITVNSADIYISNCDDLMAVDDFDTDNENIFLANDIDCTGKTVAPLFPNGFFGVFDGQNHTISGYEYTATSVFQNNMGLFSRTDGATIRNLNLRNGFIHQDIASDNVGALVGAVANTTIENVTSSWEITASQNVGGLIGWINSAGAVSITNSSATGDITGGAAVGGLVGRISAVGEVTIESVFATGNINSQYQNAGGLIGALVAQDTIITVQKSYATGNVSGSTGSARYYGGLIGRMDADQFADVGEIIIQDTYATGNISNAESGGGLIGYITDFFSDPASIHVTVQRSYASGNVTTANDFAGGLIGFIEPSGDGTIYTIQDVFAVGGLTANNPDTKGGLIGYSTHNSITSSNNYYDSTLTTATSCVGNNGIQISNCTAIDTTLDLNHFKNNNINEPMSGWDFSTIWKKQPNGYPVFGITDDGDGISATIENAAPNSGDANNDGIQDSLQSNVASFLNSTSNTYTSFEIPNTCSFTALSNFTEDAAIGKDADYSYPFGLIDFNINCTVPGATHTINVYQYGNHNPSQFTLRKYLPSNDYTAIAGSSVSAFTIGGSSGIKGTYQLTDGGTFDEDSLPNGFIEDPIGLALSALIPTIPVVDPGVPNTGTRNINFFPAITLIMIGSVLIASARKENSSDEIKGSSKKEI